MPASKLRHADSADLDPKLLAGLALLVFLVGVIVKLRAPLLEWDHVYLSAASAWAQGAKGSWIFDHPPLYPGCLAIVFRLFGPSIAVARMAHAACVLLTAALLVRFAARIAAPAAGWWAAAVFLLSPLVIQSVSSFDGADATLVPLGFLAWLMMVEMSRRHPDKPMWTGIGLVTALCGWAKLTAAVALAIGAGAFLLSAAGTTRDDPRERRWRAQVAWGLGFGAMLFVASWSVVSLPLWGFEAWWVDLLTPLRACFINIAKQGSPMTKAVRMALDAIRLLFWLSPYLLLLIVGKMGDVWRQGRAERDPMWVLLAWITGVYGITFVVLRGTQWSFPRYHLAIMPLLALWAGCACHEAWARLSRRAQARSLWLAAAFAAIGAGLLDDPLLWLSVKWKVAVLTGTLGPVMARGVAHGIAWLALPLVSWLVVKRARVVLIIGLLAGAGALDLQQARAPYATAYQYGGWGKPEVVHLVMAHLRPREAVLATPEFLYDLRTRQVPWLPITTWDSLDTVAEVLRTSAPRAVILGLTNQTLSCWRALGRHAQIQAILKQQYTRHDIGTYQVWLRHEP